MKVPKKISEEAYIYAMSVYRKKYKLKYNKLKYISH